MTDENKRIADKIRKLFALANSGYEAEAESAMLKAQQLLAEHGLTMSEIENDQCQQKQQIIEGVVESYSRPQWWIGFLAAVIADNFRCYSLYTKNCDKKILRFIGRENDVEIAKEVFTFAANFLKHQRSVIRQQYKSEHADTFATQYTNEYTHGFIHGLQAKFKEQIDKGNWGLVLVKDSDLVAYREQKKTKPGRNPQIQYGKNGGYSDGYRDGKAFEVKKQLEGGR